MFEIKPPNGEVRIATRKRWTGVANRFEKDPTEESIRVERAVITPKLITCVTRTFDRATGKERKHTVGLRPARALAYRFAGGDWVTLQPEEVSK